MLIMFCIFCLDCLVNRYSYFDDASLFASNVSYGQLLELQWPSSFPPSVFVTSPKVMPNFFL